MFLHYLLTFFNNQHMTPHGFCLLWNPLLVWANVISDSIISISYFSIPFALFYLTTKRNFLRYSWVIVCFAAFILACGTTHFMTVVTLWLPLYGIEAVAKIITALISAGTAIILWFILPKILTIPTIDELNQKNQALQDVIKERNEAYKQLETKSNEQEALQQQIIKSQKNDAITQITGGVAHDFNNMMTIIIGNLDRIQRKNRNTELTKFIENAQNGAKQATNTTRQLMSFIGDNTAIPVLIKPEKILNQAVALTNNSMPNIKVIEDYSSNSYILVNDIMATNSFVNMFINSRDAMNGKGTLILTIKDFISVDNITAPIGNWIEITITDTGYGIKPEFINKVFDPFFTTKPFGEGSGLGLNQVQGFINQSKGYINIKSVVNQGTTISIYLPSYEVNSGKNNISS